MARRATSTASTTSDTTKQKRTRAAKSFLATFADGSKSVLVVATAHKDALKAILTLSVASHSEMIAAVKDGCKIVDTTAADQEKLLTDEAA